MKYLVLSLAILLNFSITAQTYSPPENYKMESIEDYNSYNDEILKDIGFILTNPIGTNKFAVKRANKFLME